MRSAKRRKSHRQNCQRLDIEVGDIVVNQHQTKAWRNLSQAENAYLRFDYSEIHSLLKELQPSDLRLPYDRVHYNYLNGIYALENEQDQVKALAYFQEIIDEDWLALIIFIICWLYGRHNYMKDSNHLLHHAYKIGSRFHEAYYMGRILYRLGLNANAK